MAGVIHYYDENDIKRIVKDAIREYEKEVSDEELLNVVEYVYRNKGYNAAVQIASILNIRIPYWMRGD